jgi:hypothetical protein
MLLAGSVLEIRTFAELETSYRPFLMEYDDDDDDDDDDDGYDSMIFFRRHNQQTLSTEQRRFSRHVGTFDRQVVFHKFLLQSQFLFFGLRQRPGLDLSL